MLQETNVPSKSAELDFVLSDIRAAGWLWLVPDILRGCEWEISEGRLWVIET